MSWTAIALVVALVFAIVDEIHADGKSLTGWAVIIVCAYLLLPVGRG